MHPKSWTDFWRRIFYGKEQTLLEQRILCKHGRRKQASRTEIYPKPRESEFDFSPNQYPCLLSNLYLDSKAWECYNKNKEMMNSRWRSKCRLYGSLRLWSIKEILSCFINVWLFIGWNATVVFPSKRTLVAMGYIKLYSAWFIFAEEKTNLLLFIGEKQWKL